VRKMSMSGPNQQRGWNTPHEKSRLMMPRAAPPESATPLKFLGLQASDAEGDDRGVTDPLIRGPIPAAGSNLKGYLGVAGSPSATTTIDGKQLPPPPPEFGGVIEETDKDSKPWWPPRVVVIKPMGQTAEIRTHFLAACFRRSTSACETSPA
jgi:hypothetical protein